MHCLVRGGGPDAAPATAEPRTEAVSPLFVAPPDVCRAAHKTVLYGMLPVTSTEVSETPEALPSFPTDAVKAHLSDFLKSGTSPAVPQAGGRVTAATAVEPAGTMAAFILLLRQLAIELDAFGTSATWSSGTSPALPMPAPTVPLPLTALARED